MSDSIQDEVSSGITAKRLDLALATLVAGRGAQEALSAAVAAGGGAALPSGPRTSQGDGLTFVGNGPGRWLVAGEAVSGEALTERLSRLAGPLGAVCDQSDGFVVFEVSGGRLLDTLGKLATIDLAPEAFAPGDAATTSAALIGVTLWQVDRTPRFRIAVARSYERAFVHALATSAAEFGYSATAA